MKIMKPEEVETKVKERYNDNPLGWKVLFTVDQLGYPSTGLVNRRIGEQYWIKFSSYFSPQGIGAVATLDEDIPILNDNLYDKDFGIRFLDLTDRERERIFKEGKIISSVSEKIMRTMQKDLPKPDDPRKTRVVGPYPSFELNGLADISPAQRELEIKMQEAIEKMTKGKTGYIS